jgi:predicted ATPase
MARLERIEIEGYRSIRELRLDLGALNILIGANGSGKSNLVGALGLLGDLVDRQLQLHVGRRGGANALLHSARRGPSDCASAHGLARSSTRRCSSPTVGDTFFFASERALLRTEGLPADSMTEEFGVGHKESAAAELGEAELTNLTKEVFHAMRGWKVFQFHDTSASAAIKQKHAIDDNRTLRPDGANLAALLYGLRQRAPNKYRAIVETIRAIAPFFDDFLLEPDAADARVIQLEWRHRSDPSYFNAHSLSDGTLRFMCLTALLLQPAKPSLIVIDEPELGLHPAAIVQLAAMLRIVAVDSQVIVATQSVTLLDQFASEHVIVVDRSNEESTFRRLSEDQVRGWIEDYSLGDLWLKNVLGGRPS